MESPALSTLLRSEYPAAVRVWKSGLTDQVDAVAAGALAAVDDAACLRELWQHDVGATFGLLQSLFARRALHSALVLSGLLWSGPIALTADLVTRLALSEDVAPSLRVVAADRVLEVLGSGAAPLALWRAVLQRPSPCALLPEGWPELLADHLDVLVEAADHSAAHVAAQARLQLSGQGSAG